MYHIYFYQDDKEIKFNDELYDEDDIDWWVNWFNSIYDPVKFFKKEVKK